MLTQMTTQPVWRELPAALADVLEPELEELSREIVATIGREVPEYARPLEGPFGRAVRMGVGEALRRFLGQLRDPGAAGRASSAVYVSLGRGEQRAGRTLDALQAAYRVGARLAWRRFARAARVAGVHQETVALLAEAIFAYIDELSAESVEGYAQAQSESAGERQRARVAVVRALLSGRAAADELTELADAAAWALPSRAAALACPPDAAPGISRRLGPGAIGATYERHGCVLVPDAEGPARRDAVRLATRSSRAALGSDGPLAQLPASWRLAVGTLALAAREPALAAREPALAPANDREVGALLIADEHLGSLLLDAGAVATERIAQIRLAALDALTPAARERMQRSALAFVRQQGNAVAMARALHIHPQTARYRIARLRELLGDQLRDPDARFELEAALRLRMARSV